ncbi:MAG: 6-bladed beta-propeller, partial [Gemmatimonadetes bacterium]|nr:6-bladed beta-propeller [Gemmatimonadota bacterium]
MIARRIAHLTFTVTLTLFPAPAMAQAWQVDPRPRLTIGDDPDDPMQQFVRIRDVLALPGGRIAILDAGLPAIRVFDTTGRWVRNVGRTGNGPGEFRDPIDLAFDGTGLGVLDRDGRIEW